MLKVKIKNLKEIQLNLERIAANIANQSKNIEFQKIDDIYNESQELVPVATGKLKASGKKEYNREGGSTVSYQTDYGLYVHEDLEKHHPNGIAKFLEIPFIKHSDKIKDELKKMVK